MNICLNCGEMFKTPKPQRDIQLEYFGTPCNETWFGCPTCYSGAYVETWECDGTCGGHIDGKYIETITGERYCENCYMTKNLNENY